MMLQQKRLRPIQQRSASGAKMKRKGTSPPHVGGNRCCRTGHRGCLLIMVMLSFGLAMLLLHAVGKSTLQHARGATKAAYVEAVLWSNVGIGNSNTQLHTASPASPLRSVAPAGGGTNAVHGGIAVTPLVIRGSTTVNITTVARATPEDPDFKVLVDRTQRCSCVTRNQPASTREIRLYDVNRTQSFVHGAFSAIAFRINHIIINLLPPALSRTRTTFARQIRIPCLLQIIFPQKLTWLSLHAGFNALQTCRFAT